MLTYSVPNEIKYTGVQLHSLWIYTEFGLQGDAIVCFQGPCEVLLGEMVDQADVIAGEGIYSERMLHFIAEHFQMDLEKAVTRQRLFMALARDLIAELSGAPVRREGDDLYDGDRKISVSIATLSRVSSLMHVGINISSKNTPIPTKSLNDLGIDPTEFGTQLMERYRKELEGISLARCKVKGVD